MRCRRRAGARTRARPAVPSHDLGHRGFIAPGDRGDERRVIDLTEIFRRHSSTWSGRVRTKLGDNPPERVWLQPYEMRPMGPAWRSAPTARSVIRTGERPEDEPVEWRDRIPVGATEQAARVEQGALHEQRSFSVGVGSRSTTRAMRRPGAASRHAVAAGARARGPRLARSRRRHRRAARWDGVVRAAYRHRRRCDPSRRARPTARCRRANLGLRRAHTPHGRALRVSRWCGRLDSR